MIGQAAPARLDLTRKTGPKLHFLQLRMGPEGPFRGHAHKKGCSKG
jgi:hypothetical protein